ncbi:chemotaxis protein CheD [Salsuginibacillus kocurii]|uniref:chemotaxis protein CheD n=1 Tax=Salsuginibacillus kocurii TaxID=427078 RepID=UPI000369CFC1|nr:hypothetical protein [Salsuginibacillus kocurii]
MPSVRQVVKVGMADMNDCSPPQLLRTSGLGSCIGLVIYDEQCQRAVMAHVMLPDSSMSKPGALNIAKYADTAIAAAIEKLESFGSMKINMQAKIAGGAQMFSFAGSSEIMRVGPRNVEAVKKFLNNYQIRLIAEDTGGSNGRTIEFDPEDASLKIRTVNQGEVVI